MGLPPVSLLPQGTVSSQAPRPIKSASSSGTNVTLIANNLVNFPIELMLRIFILMEDYKSQKLFKFVCRRFYLMVQNFEGGQATILQKIINTNYPTYAAELLKEDPTANSIVKTQNLRKTLLKHLFSAFESKYPG